MDESAELEYVGFWRRVLAWLIDATLLGALLSPLLWIVFYRNFQADDLHVLFPLYLLVGVLLPGFIILAFWNSHQATPGKMAISAIILDEKTASPASIGQHVGRYFGYFLALMPFGLGLLWIAVDRKKQGLHDKLAGTMVIRVRRVE